MYAPAVGYKPGNSVLAGLKGSGDAGAFAKGQGMAAAADLNLSAEQQNQKMGVDQMQADSQLRQQGNRNQAQRAQNETQERTAKGALGSRRAVFDTNMNFSYAGLRKQNQLKLQQALLNSFAGELS